jgi:hypothetical protein
MHCDDRFLPLPRDDRDLDLALLDEKDGVGRIALSENALILVIFRDGAARLYGGEKDLGIEGGGRVSVIQCSNQARESPSAVDSSTLQVAGLI